MIRNPEFSLSQTEVDNVQLYIFFKVSPRGELI